MSTQSSSTTETTEPLPLSARVNNSLNMTLEVYLTAKIMARRAAEKVAAVIREKNAAGEWANIGLLTGSTPKLMYQELVQMHLDEGLSFARVRIFMLDEYYPMEPENSASFFTFVDEHFVSQLADFSRDNLHIKNGSTPDHEIASHCAAYEQAITDCGGIDIWVIGIGRNLHIGFNEPGTPFDSRTGLRELTDLTRRDAASGFFGLVNVPTHGLSAGIGTIMDAKKVIILAINEGKALGVRALCEMGPDVERPASALQNHPDCVLMVDEAAAGEITGIKYPWMVGDEPDWQQQRWVETAVFWLSEKVSKSIPTLEEADFNDNGLSGILAAVGTAQEIRETVFSAVNQRITRSPGPSKPARILAVSPHPDDDVIQMGGSLQRLVADGHEVHVSFATSGRIAVFDCDALPIVSDLNSIVEFAGVDQTTAAGLRNALLSEASRKLRAPGVLDSKYLSVIKGNMRRSEAVGGLRQVKVPKSQIYFEDLPFYETLAIEKDPPTQKDIEKMVARLRQVKPEQIYAAGDLSDPHGTHRVCLWILVRALEIVANDDWAKANPPMLLLYRGAWAEWQPQDMDVIVPLTEAELQVALGAMREHKTQIRRDATGKIREGGPALFPGVDDRPFDERAEHRKRLAGTQFTSFGCENIVAAEGFRQYELSEISTLGL